MRVVIDTDVIVASMRSKTGASRGVMRLVEHKRLTPIATASIMFEYEAVLKRQEHLRAARMTIHDVDKLIDALVSFVEPVTSHFMWRPQLKDPNDEMILEAAVNGRAKAIVTFNLKHFARIAPRFGIDILEPADLLRRILP